MIYKLGLIFVTLFAAFSLNAQELVYENRFLDFTTFVGQIQSGYAPLQLKETTGVVNWDRLKDQYLRRLKKVQSNREYYYLLVRFAAEFNDGHLRAILYTSQRAFLKFSVDYIDGKVIVVESREPSVNVGDEILHVDGKPVREALEDLIQYRRMGSKLANLRHSAKKLTFRNGQVVPVPLDPSILLSFQTSTGSQYEQSFSWEYYGNPEDEIQRFQLQKQLLGSSQPVSQTPEISEISQNHVAKDGMEASRASGCSEKSKIFLPLKAKKINAPFLAYTWKVKGKTLGYVEISNYRMGTKTNSEYGKVLNRMNRTTDGLIVDLTFNCGGHVFNVYPLASIFLKHSRKPLDFQFVGNKAQKIRYELEATGSTAFGVSKNYLLEISGLIKDAWRGGHWLADPIPFPRKIIKPHPRLRYSKPMIILVDEMSSSAGEMFPAFLQGAGRAKILGARTAGMGGSVADSALLPFSQVRTVVTSALILRPDGVPIENNGVVPDIPYQIKAQDFVTGLKKYRKFYTEKLLDLL